MRVHHGPLTATQVEDIASALVELQGPKTTADGMVWVGLVAAGNGYVRLHGAHSPVAADTAIRLETLSDGRVALVLRHLGTDTVLGAASAAIAEVCRAELASKL